MVAEEMGRESGPYGERLIGTEWLIREARKGEERMRSYWEVSSLLSWVVGGVINMLFLKGSLLAEAKSRQ